MTGRRSVAPGRIRIIGGSLRNSRLLVADQLGLRPTAERVRETLFNWLAPSIVGARCLDLCAGTGALGIEALSRGAAAVQFVEPDALAAKALRENLDRLKVPGGQVATVDAEAFLRGSASPWDMVFIDPPFALGLWTSLAWQLERLGWLSRRALIYVECPVDQAPDLPVNWQLQRDGRAGEVRYALYRREMGSG